MNDYEVVAESGIRLDRRYGKGERIKLSPGQAQYLVLNGKIEPADKDGLKTTGDDENSTREIPVND